MGSSPSFFAFFYREGLFGGQKHDEIRVAYIRILIAPALSLRNGVRCGHGWYAIDDSMRKCRV